MAGADYKSCDVCGTKTFYDARVDYDLDLRQHEEPRPFRVGDWKVICVECAKDHEVKVVPKSKAKVKRG